MNRARLSAVRAVSRTREDLFVEALARANVRLAEMRVQPCYAEVLCALAREALAQLDGEVLLRADPRDECILRSCFPDLRVAFDLQTRGGVEASTRDGCIVVVNTLEARLAQAEDVLRQQVMPLF